MHFLVDRDKLACMIFFQNMLSVRDRVPINPQYSRQLSKTGLGIKSVVPTILT